MRKFIDDNNITFNVGTRNSVVTTLIGYAQHKGLSKPALKKELASEIEDDSFIEEEIDRLFKYCKDRNYAAFWSTSKAKKQYKF